MLYVLPLEPPFRAAGPNPLSGESNQNRGTKLVAGERLLTPSHVSQTFVTEVVRLSSRAPAYRIISL
jgi:hypothetical protein